MDIVLTVMGVHHLLRRTLWVPGCSCSWLEDTSSFELKIQDLGFLSTCSDGRGVVVELFERDY